MRRIKEKYNVLAISVDRGLITLVERDGSLATYRQRGINKLTPGQLEAAIRVGKLHPRVLNYKELPSNYDIYFEDPTVMGKPHKTFRL